MPTITNNADGGSDGTTVTAGNSGGASGTAYDSVVGTPTITFDNDHASSGSLAYKVTGGTGAQQMVWSTALGTVGQLWGRFYIWSSGAPSTNIGIVRFTVGGSQTARLRYETTGQLMLSDAGNGPEVTTTSAIPTGQWVRVEFQITFTPATGTCDLRYYSDAESETATESLSSSSLNAALNCDTVQIGCHNTVTLTYWMDDIEINTTGFPGPAPRGRGRAPMVTPISALHAATW